MPTIDEAWNIPAASILGPPPPGLDVSHNLVTTNNAACIALVVVTVIVVFIRFFVLVHVQRNRPFLDDWMMLLTLIPLIVLTAIACIGGLKYGLGTHVWVNDLGPLSIGKKNLFSYLIIYVAQLLMIKLAILMFYRRILGMNWMIQANIALSTAWAVGSIIAIPCAPVPISYFWTEYVDPTGGYYRYPFYHFWVGNGASNVLTDVLILLVPIPVVWRQNMRVRQKLIVSVFLGMGISIVVASVVRLHYLSQLNKSMDISYLMGIISVWSTVEPCVGIICACLPAVQPFVRFILKVEYRAYIGKKFSFTSQRSNTSALRAREQGRTDSPIRVANGFDFRPDLNFGDGKNDDEMRLTIEALVETDRGREERERLQHYLGPMFIRVQHDVELTVSESRA